MSVDTFWRRTPPDAAASLSAAELADLVPDWFDEGFAELTQAGILVGAEDTGELALHVLVLGAGDGPHRAVAETLSRPPAGFDRQFRVGVYGADVVRAAAGFLSGAPVANWAELHADALAAKARSLGYRRPMSAEWTSEIAATATELVALVQAAGDAGEVLVYRLGG
jgi:NAD(P)-dependent dehydrogenase (short-subunit alcohol dehydrogenase family)